jgi:hypothetical protein
MDFIRARGGPETFAVMGLCSGADSAHAVAMADPRVRAVVYIDGFVWRTTGFWLRYWTTRKLEASRWRRYMRRRAAQRRGGPREAGEAPEIYQREMPTPEQFRTDLKALLDRGTAVFAVYTAGLIDYAYRGQIEEMVGGLAQHPLFATEYFPRADHLFADIVEHEKLLARLGAWMRDRAGSAGAREAIA